MLRCAHRGLKGSPPGPPCLTSDACCVQGGPAHSGGPFAHKTSNAPVVDLYSNDFFSCTFQNYLPAHVSDFESGKSSGSETCVASGWGTCSPWTSDSSSPWSLCREHRGALVSVVSHSGSESGSGTWTLQMSSHCRFSCEGQHHQAGDQLPQTPEGWPHHLCTLGKLPTSQVQGPRHTPPLRRSRSRWGPRVALLPAPAPTLTASPLRQAENRERQL